MSYALLLGCLIPTRVPQIEVSCRAVFDRLGVKFDDNIDFSCCPNSPYIKPLDNEAWISVAARNLALAEEAGLELVTPCPGCSNTLIEAKHELDNNEVVRTRANERLKNIDKEYKGTVKVRHLLQVLVEDIGLKKVEEMVERPIPIKAAAHYGCHLLKPSNIVGFENPFNARSLEDLVTTVGGKPVDYENRDLCCGMVLGSTSANGSMDLAHRKLNVLKQAGAQAMVLVCPTCFLQYDVGQLRASRKYNVKYDIPVLYFTQLIGLSMGLNGKELGTQLHRVKTTGIEAALDGK